MVEVAGKNMNKMSPRGFVRHGVAYIPEDRQKHGLVLSFSIADNQVLRTYNRHPFANGLWRKEKAVFDNARRLLKRFDIRARDHMISVDTLSGGNQQKVIISRELSRDIKLLIANQPTRGVDVGSIEYIHTRILDLRHQGVAILLISTELDEVMALSDRIGVMVGGKINHEFDAGTTDRTQIGLMMSGVQAADNHMSI
jgi:simple sugar transport system ATP-binding protein